MLEVLQLSPREVHSARWVCWDRGLLGKGSGPTVQRLPQRLGANYREVLGSVGSVSVASVPSIGS
eukprot:2821914-Alexandrium_andersonii.AAC.1